MSSNIGLVRVRSGGRIHRGSILPALLLARVDPAWTDRPGASDEGGRCPDCSASRRPPGKCCGEVYQRHFTNALGLEVGPKIASTGVGQIHYAQVSQESFVAERLAVKKNMIVCLLNLSSSSAPPCPNSNGYGLHTSYSGRPELSRSSRVFALFGLDPSPVHQSARPGNERKAAVL